ncbi:MAG: DUF423 domain-containing protein [Chitinophagaceae bacterium]
MHKLFLIVASISSAITVALGAFGAHTLKRYVSADLLNTFETGVRYQFYHSMALFIVAILFEKYNSKYTVYAGNSFILGIILFSGSLYLLTFLNSTENIGIRKIGIITPFGGLFFILGWLSLAWSVYKKT